MNRMNSNENSNEITSADHRCMQVEILSAIDALLLYGTMQSESIVRNSGRCLLCLYARRAPMRILDIFGPRTLFSGHSACRA